MKKFLFTVLALLGAFVAPANAQQPSSALILSSCGTASGYVAALYGILTMDTTGKLCINATVTATATTAFTAASSLPTISPGAGAAGYESLAGAQYSQPVFGSASGGGTQVDATHGLPVNCVVGCAAGTGANNADSVAAVSTGLGPVQAYPFLWNGATFDRWYGDKTNGAFVNVKTSVLSTGAATSALQSTINTTLGTPMQQTGGSVTANAGTNLNTSALATSANQSGTSATTAHGCSTAGYGELGCLGQIDDDVKGAISAGTNIIGKVGIDQTTPGTTNGVQVNAALPAGANVIGGVFGSPNVTRTDCSIALTTGGVAQNIITAGASLHGYHLMNIDTSAGSGEPVWTSETGTAAASTIGSYPLAAPTATTFAGAGSYSSEFGSGTSTNVSVIAATSGHKISCTKW